MRISLISTAALSLSACATAAAPPADQPPVYGQTPGYVCSKDNLQQFVGKTKSAALEEQMLRVSGAKLVRWVPPGTAISMVFRADRLTVHLDDQNRVTRLSCG